jgi:HCOMODA/2-hydroxy-3-carboxy-muconic semialdehyde decarboxylase
MKKQLLFSFLVLIFAQVHAATVQEQMDQNPAVKTVIEELVLANHILYDQNAVDGWYWKA